MRSVNNSKYDVTDGQRVNRTARHCRQATLAVSHSSTDATVSNPDSFLKISSHHSSSLEIDLGGADFLTQHVRPPAADGQVVFSPARLSFPPPPSCPRCSDSAPPPLATGGKCFNVAAVSSQIFFFYTPSPPANHSLLITLMSAQCS